MHEQWVHDEHVARVAYRLAHAVSPVTAQRRPDEVSEVHVQPIGLGVAGRAAGATVEQVAGDLPVRAAQQRGAAAARPATRVGHDKRAPSGPQRARWRVRRLAGRGLSDLIGVTSGSTTTDCVESMRGSSPSMCQPAGGTTGRARGVPVGKRRCIQPTPCDAPCAHCHRPAPAGRAKTGRVDGWTSWEGGTSRRRRAEMAQAAAPPWSSSIAAFSRAEPKSAGQRESGSDSGIGWSPPSAACAAATS